MGWLGPYTWFNPPKPGPQSRAHCGIVCALSITNSHPKYIYMRKVTLRSLHKLENISKPLVESTFSFNWWILVSNIIFDALFSKLKMSIYTKRIQKTNSITVEYQQPVVLLKFALYKMLFSKCRCDCAIHELWCITMVEWCHSG